MCTLPSSTGTSALVESRAGANGAAVGTQGRPGSRGNSPSRPVGTRAVSSPLPLRAHCQQLPWLCSEAGPDPSWVCFLWICVTPSSKSHFASAGGAGAMVPARSRGGVIPAGHSQGTPSRRVPATATLAVLGQGEIPAACVSPGARRPQQHSPLASALGDGCPGAGLAGAGTQRKLG